MTSLMSVWCKIWTYFTPFSGVTIVDFKQINVSWGITRFLIFFIYFFSEFWSISLLISLRILVTGLVNNIPYVTMRPTCVPAVRTLQRTWPYIDWGLGYLCFDSSKLFRKYKHCMKSAQIRSFFWSVFSCIWIEYGDLPPYSVRIQENTEQKKFRIWTLFTQWKKHDNALTN